MAVSALELDVIAPKHQTVNLRSTLHPEKRAYELRYESEMSMEDIARLATLSKAVEPLMDGSMLDPPTARLLDDWLDEALEILCHTKIEPEVIQEMGYDPKWMIVQFFGDTCMDKTGDLQEAAKETAVKKAPPPKSKTTAA